MYYRSLIKGESCSSNTRRLETANIKEIQSLYCSGVDLQIPLVSSLSPCSDQHKNKVDECMNEFAETFTHMNGTHESLCRYDISCFLFN